MCKNMNSNQKKIVVAIFLVIFLVFLFVILFKLYSSENEIPEKTDTNVSVSTTETFIVPEIEDEIPAVDDTYVIETQKNDDIYTFNYETRSPDEIMKGEYLTVAQVTTLPFTQPQTTENIE